VREVGGEGSMSIRPRTLHQNGITVREGGIKDKTNGDLYNSPTGLASLLFFLELQYSLGLSLLNSNVSSEMAQLVATNQECLGRPLICGSYFL